jgi:hypothetical protein
LAPVFITRHIIFKVTDNFETVTTFQVIGRVKSLLTIIKAPNKKSAFMIDIIKEFVVRKAY